MWIQSIHGRRFAASTGPVAPSTNTGTRSHQALKIAIVACISPTLLCTIAPIGRPVDLGIAVRDRDRVLLVQAQQHLRVAVAEQVDEAVVQPAIGGAGVQRDIGQVELAQHQRDRVAAPVIARLVGENRPLDGGRTGCVCRSCVASPPEPPPTGPLSGGDSLGVGARLRRRARFPQRRIAAAGPTRREAGKSWAGTASYAVMTNNGSTAYTTYSMSAW